MNFILDLHCHTVASGHAYSTITENAAHAASIGLTHIAISDHGPEMPGGAHLYAFANQRALPDYIHGVRVLKSAEVNIVDYNGKLDLPATLLREMDFTIVSLHRIKPPVTKEEHTYALIMAMEKPEVSIIGHPCNVHFEIDIQAVVAAAARTGTILEVNNQTLTPESFRYHGDETHMEMLAYCKEYDVPVIAGSDAHFSTQVGQLDRAKAVILAAGMPERLVLNTCVDRFFETVAKKRGQSQ